MLLTRVAQGVGIGFLSSLIIGFFIGVTGYVHHSITPWLILIITYLSAGIISGRRTAHPYIASTLAGIILSMINQVFAATYLSDGVLNASSLLYSFVMGVGLCLIGSLIVDSLGKGKAIRG